MKKMNLWLLASMFAGALAVVSCSSDDNTTPAGPSTPTGGTTVNPANMKMSALSGFVYDADGNAMKDVKVTSGTESVVTGRDGGFVFSKVNSVNGRTIVKFTKDGYVEVVRSLNTTNAAVWEVVMNESWGENVGGDWFMANTDIELSAGNMKVGLQGDAYNTANESGEATGVPYDDYVTATAFYLSPDNENFAEAMPGGDLAAVRADGSEAQLISYGMTKVDLVDIHGKKLQLAPGKPATLTFPIPEKFKDNTPAEIPLWSFDETTGLWKEEGVAKLKGNVYEGQVTHFSWVNLDYPEKRATLKITVKDNAGNFIPNQKVDLDGQRSFFTNVKGEIETFVPTNTDFYVTVHSADYGNYEPEVKVDVPAITSAGSTYPVTITLPKLAHISGSIVNKGVGSNLATLWIEYKGKETKRVHSDINGLFYMNAPANYTGDAVLKVRATDGTTNSYEITLDGKDQAFTLEITPEAQSGGKATLTMKEGGKVFNITVPNVNYESLDGVSIVGNDLEYTASTGDYGDEYIYANLYINNYDERQQSFNGAAFNFGESAGNNYINANSFNKDGGAPKTTVKITKESNGYYRFQLSGDAMVYAEGIQGGKEEANATINADFTSPLLGKGKNLGKITKKDASFPSFTPWIDGKYPTGATQITESPKLGKGVLLWYFDETMGYADYLNFKKQLVASLGDPVECFDQGDDTSESYDIAISYFYKNGKYAMVSFCPWRENHYEEEGAEPLIVPIGAIRETHAARIHVHVLEGVTIDYTLFMEMGHFGVKGEVADWEPVWKKNLK